MTTSSVQQDLAGTLLRGGEYVLKQLIARGGQASVYRAYARALDTDVAVKILHPGLATDLGFRERFHDEARRLAQLHHPNLLEVHWYGEDGELIYIVMRLVRGGTLSNRLQALGGSLPMTNSGRLIVQIANALQHAHDHDVLHLDVKPANILLGQADWPLVADLGLTRAIARQPSHAREMRVAGTPAYMSPEQCRGEDLDGRSDQYSLAVMAFELLTGQRPFQAATTDGLMQLHLHNPPPRPSSVSPGLPGPVEDVLLRGLAKNRADRFPEIAEFGHALADAIDHARGVSLETKGAVAGAAPNVLAILVLVLSAPFLLAMLPVGTIFGRLPLAWPFQLLLAGGVAALLVGIRWHLIGLIGRAAEHGVHAPAPAWRRAFRASTESVVNLLYVLIMYRLVGVPLLGVLSTVVSPQVYQVLATGLALVVAVAAIAILIRLFRTAGPLPTLVVLILGWTVAVVLPTGQLEFVGASTVVPVAQLVIAGTLVVLLLTQRSAVAASVGRFAADRLGPLLVEARPGITPEEANAGRQQIVLLTGVLLDFTYLLIAYALLRGPALAVLG